MKILGVDSSTTAASVAIVDDEKLVCELILNDKLTHSQKLLPLIDEALKYSNTDISQIDAFASVTGPGSFTGLRIGVATVKGLASCFNTPVASVNSLAALAMNFPFSKILVCSMLDARAGRVFAALYDTSSGYPEENLKTDLYNISDLLKTLNNIEKPIIFTGDGAIANKKTIEEATKNSFFVAPQGLLNPRASAACTIAIHENKFINYSDLLPEYFRKSQVEQDKEKK